jgi:hypothetical protein
MDFSVEVSPESNGHHGLKGSVGTKASIGIGTPEIVVRSEMIDPFQHSSLSGFVQADQSVDCPFGRAGKIKSRFYDAPEVLKFELCETHGPST